LKIEPSAHRYRTLRRPTHREETAAAFLASDESESSFSLEPVPSPEAAHNNLSPASLSQYLDTDESIPDFTEIINAHFSEPSVISLQSSFSQLSLSPRTSLLSFPQSPRSTSPDQPIPQTPITTMAVVAQNMPIFGERGAPKFDNKQPNGLGRFFTQLEALFVRCAVQADDDKKQYAVSFANSDVADTWEALAEYTDPLKTYNDFKKRLCEVYNQVNLRYILPDLDRLVGERQRLFMRTLQDLSEFHLQFNTIAQYLTTAGLISQREQSQAYMRVFEEALHNKVMMRLQIKHPDHHPSLPYNIDDICEMGTARRPSRDRVRRANDCRDRAEGRGSDHSIAGSASSFPVCQDRGFGNAVQGVYKDNHGCDQYVERSPPAL